MAMGLDFLKKFLADNKGHYNQNDPNIQLEHQFLKKGADSDNDHINMTPKDFLNNKPEPNSIIGDDGNYSKDQTNPFLKLMDKNAPQGTIRNFLGRMLGGGLEPGTGTTPNNFLDNQTLAQNQKQPGLSAKNPNDAIPAEQTPPPAPAPQMDYSMPSALDPQSIEELRLSLLTQAGQYDPANPNGLSGRMNSPNSQGEISNQMDETKQMGDQLRSEANSLQNDRNNQP